MSALTGIRPLAPARDGLYALASLDGAPLDARDLAVLGLHADDAERGCAIAIRDGQATVAGRGGDGAFLGHLDEPAALAETLGLDRSSSAATLALAALDRFGADAPTHMPGEWSLLRWNAAARTLVLLVSDTIRDVLLFATDGRRVAVAPHIDILRRLDWIDATPWNRGLLPYLGQTELRNTLTGETMLRGVRRMMAGTQATIAPNRTTSSMRGPLPVPEPWRGSFTDAVEALDATFRQIVRQQMTRHRGAAIMLSGGLDSSLIATFAGAERLPGFPLIAVTSAAPPGSGFADEMPFSCAVADAAGMSVLAVVPDAAVSVYQPSDRLLRSLQHPIVSPRHYVYDALFAAAVDHGADTIFDGSHGEWTVTGYLSVTNWQQRMRDIARNAIGFVGRSAQEPFQVRLSPSAIAFARQEFDTHPRKAIFSDPYRRDGNAPCGYATAIANTLLQPTTTPWPGLRLSLPFRDRRLLALFAGMPGRFLVEAGMTRAPARAMLAGKIPDAVRLRPHGLAFSPDYMMRIRGQAMAARASIAAYRRAGVDEWIDLDWLDAALVRMAARRDAPMGAVFQVQSTATAAAFLYYWLTDAA